MNIGLRIVCITLMSTMALHQLPGAKASGVVKEKKLKKGHTGVQEVPFYDQLIKKINAISESILQQEDNGGYKIFIDFLKQLIPQKKITEFQERLKLITSQQSLVEQFYLYLLTHASTKELATLLEQALEDIHAEMLTKKLSYYDPGSNTVKTNTLDNIVAQAFQHYGLSSALAQKISNLISTQKNTQFRNVPLPPVPTPKDNTIIDGKDLEDLLAAELDKFESATKQKEVS